MKRNKSPQPSLVLLGILAVFACILIYVKSPDTMPGENTPENTPVPSQDITGGNIWMGQDALLTSTPSAAPSLEGEGQAALEGIWANINGADLGEIVRKISGRTIIIKKEGAGYGDAIMQMEELPIYRQLRLVVTGLAGGGITEGQVIRVAEDTLCQGMPPTPTPVPEAVGMDEGEDAAPPPIETPTPSPVPTLSPEDPLYAWRFDPVKEMELVSEEQEDGSYVTEILLTLDKSYVYRLYEDKQYYYISLIRPKEIYQKIVVVDAGHGGLDAGTYSEGSKYLEKTVNLDIVLYLKELLDAQEEIKVYYTRTSDFKPSLSQRVNLANDVEADFFLSVHCNASESKALNGTEVLYSTAQNGWEGMNSKRFAQICMDKMNQYLGLKDRGLVPRDHNVTIIKDAQVPVALVEVGFMSNVSDMAVLAGQEAQRNIAWALYEAILEGYAEMEGEAAEAGDI